MKYQFMQDHADEFSIERMSTLFELSRSRYYQLLDAVPSERSQENTRLLIKIQAAYPALVNGLLKS